MLNNNLYHPHPYSPIHFAWKLSFPVLISYFTLSMLFGVLFNQLHDPWYFAPIMSLFVYACAVQVIALSIMAIHGSYWLILLSTFFVAFRNSFYGLSLLKRYRYPLLLKVYMIYTLVDANYAIMVNHPPYENKEQDKLFCFYLALFMQLSWILGTLFGAFFSQYLGRVNGLTFILIAYFAIMVFENYLKNKSFLPILIGSIAAIIAFISVPSEIMLFFAIAICFITQSFIYLKGRKYG